MWYPERVFYVHARLLKPPVFKRLSGVSPDTFQAMSSALAEHLPAFGRPPRHCREDRFLMTSMYWRECRQKAQVVADPRTGRIVATAFSAGKTHDFKLYQQSRVATLARPECLADSEYLGLKKRHDNSCLPSKKSKLHPLTHGQKQDNRQLSRERFVIEHIIRSVKIFRILADRYRNWRKRFGLRFNLIAALYNFGRPG